MSPRIPSAAIRGNNALSFWAFNNEFLKERKKTKYNYHTGGWVLFKKTQLEVLAFSMKSWLTAIPV